MSILVDDFPRRNLTHGIEVKTSKWGRKKKKKKSPYGGTRNRKKKK